MLTTTTTKKVIVVIGDLWSKSILLHRPGDDVAIGKKAVSLPGVDSLLTHHLLCGISSCNPLTSSHYTLNLIYETLISKRTIQMYYLFYCGYQFVWNYYRSPKCITNIYLFVLFFKFWYKCIGSGISHTYPEFPSPPH